MWTRTFCVLALFSLSDSTTAWSQDRTGVWTFQLGTANQETSWELQQSGAYLSGALIDPSFRADLKSLAFNNFVAGLLTYPNGGSTVTPGVLFANGDEQTLQGTWYEWLFWPRPFMGKRTMQSANLVIADDFETGQPSTNWSELTNVQGSGAPNPNAIAFVETGSAHSGRYALRIHYDKDEQGAKLNLYNLPIAQRGEMYIRFWQMFPKPFNQTNVKQARIFITNGANCTNVAQGIEGASELLLFGKPNGQEMFAGAYRCDDDAVHSSPYLTFPFPAGEWVKVAFYVKYNQPSGAANGIFRVWRDDVLIFNKTDAVFLLNQQQTLCDGVWVGGNYSGGGVNPVPFDRYVDDIHIAWTPDGDVPPAANPDSSKYATLTATAALKRAPMKSSR